MNLSSMLREREAAGRPVTVGLIGAGKFGTMFLAQARLTPGMHVVGVADLDVARATRQLTSAGWDAQAIAAASLGDALKTRRTHVTPDADALIALPEIEVIVEATGIPGAGIRHALARDRARQAHRDGQRRGRCAGGPAARPQGEGAPASVYSLAWGDQPALICEQVDWARTCGFKVIAAGKGTRYEPHYHRSTPDTLWDILDKYLKIEDRGSINPKMFNSFVDGTKSGIEMTAVCNATGLVPQSGGLGFPPATRFELADVCKPKAAGGTLEKEGVTEVVSSVDRDGRDVPHHLALGTYVVFEGESEYARRCFNEYAMLPDASGRLRRALPADPHDRPRARRLGRERGAARRTDRRAHRLPLRRRRHRQARAEARRGARRRRRLLRLGPPGAGRTLAGGRSIAARPRQ